METFTTLFHIPFVFKENHLHPMLVHFPIALLYLATFFYCYAAIKKSQNAETLGFANLITGSLLAWPALYAGLIAEEVVEEVAEASPQLHEILELHEKLGYGVAIFFSLLSLWAIVIHRRPGKRVIPLFIFALFIGVGALGLQGYLGSYMVYEGGLGTSSKTAPVAERETD